jgi:pyruvate formate lyase activating enzyme
MERGIVFAIKRGAIHDGPGIRTTVFLKGCPLNCLWCHNPEGKDPNPVLSTVRQRCIGCGACVAACLNGAVSMRDGYPETDRSRCTACGTCVAVCPTGARAILGKECGVNELLSHIERDRVFFETSGGGVTFSGGEPLYQPDFLLSCLRACKAAGLHTALDTAGYAPKETVLQVAQYTDLFLFDLKDMDPERHHENCGVPLEPILENLRALDEAEAEVWIRIPLIPGVNCDEATIDAYIRFLSGLKRRHPVFLLPYHPVGEEKYRRLDLPYPLQGLEPPSGERVEEIRAAFSAAGFRVRVGG